MVEGRDFFIDELLEDYRGKTVEPVSMPADAPLFLMYTSGTTGRPKGCEHSTGGYLSYVTGTSRYYQDIHPDDTYWCFADIGWITGHSYIVYGPLSLGTTSVMYEGVPTYPDAGRPWRIAQRLGVNIFHTAPTTIRMLRKLGPEEPAKYDYHFKTMTTVGEPIEPDVWRWYHSFVGKGEAAITDTWWQTENGGFLGSTLPGLQPMKPGSCGPGVLGIYPVIYDENGEVVEKGSGKAGNICIRNPWPGSFQTVWGQPERFIDTYYAKYCHDKDSKDWRDWPYFAGDGAVQAADGYFRILGRIDDVINIAGHRLGTKELESASITVEEIAEAAAVPVIDEVRGKIVEMYVSLKPGLEPSKEIEQKVSDAIDREIGKIARPKNVWIVSDMPKTRSGKIMRRVIAGISNFADVGDGSSAAGDHRSRHRCRTSRRGIPNLRSIMVPMGRCAGETMGASVCLGALALAPIVSEARPRGCLWKECAGPRREPRQNVGAVDGLITGEHSDIGGRPVDRDVAARRVGDEDHADACLKPSQRLFVQLGVRVAGRDHFHREIGRPRPVAGDTSSGLRPLLGHECGIGRAHGVRSPAEQKARFRGEHAAGARFRGAAVKQRQDPCGHRAVLSASGRHLVEPSCYKLEAAIVGGQPQQLLGGQSSSGRWAGWLRGHRATRRTVAPRRASGRDRR
jgi:acyl-coenzyme A synthetase/AMP-(fatty) acid ligase